MFYTFNQNNFIGQFVYDENLTEYVIIEARNASEAESRAQSIGIYFDGCEDGRDCCGDRWYACAESYGREVPTVCGEPTIPFDGSGQGFFFRDDAEIDGAKGPVVIHYLDGRIEWADRV